MASCSHRTDNRNFPNHVFLVLSKCLVFYTPLDNLERELFRISQLLLDSRISNLTFFNPNGYLNDFFWVKYGKCVNKNLDCSSSKDRFSFGRVYLKERKQELSNRNHTLIYFISRLNKDLVISFYNKELHSKKQGLLLLVIDNTHSHSKLLGLNPGLSNHKHEPRWISERTKKGICLEYQVPDESSITQPEIEKSLCTFEGVKVPVPDLLISLRASLRDSILFFLNQLYFYFTSNLNSILHMKRFSLFNLDKSLFISSLTLRLGNIFNAGMSIVHSFGPQGIQPWFLSQVEMYEFFGIDVSTVLRCIHSFSNTDRRWGK